MLCCQIPVEHPRCAGQVYELHFPESGSPNFRVRGYQCDPARFKGGSETEAIILRRQLHSDTWAKERFAAAPFYLFGDPGLPVGYRTFRVNFSSFGCSFRDFRFLVFYPESCKLRFYHLTLYTPASLRTRGPEQLGVGITGPDSWRRVCFRFWFSPLHLVTMEASLTWF
jgi:hypothetical protein